MKGPAEMCVAQGTTAMEVKAWLMEAARRPGGAICPITGRFTKIGDRAFNTAMAAALRYFGENTAPGEYLLTSKLPVSILASKQHTTMKYWGFLEPPERTRSTKGGSVGLWRITEKGRQFLRGDIKVPLKVVSFNGKLERLHGPDVSIFEITEGFDYEKFIYSDPDKE